MKEELVDVYDKNKNITGKIIKREDIELLNEDEYIITVHCFIINSINQILLTQRSLTKNRGGRWEETHGALKAGEISIRGIQRELKEEIEKLKTTTGSKFFDKLRQKDFPERDFYLCTEINKFDFILKVKKDEKENLYIEKVNV